MDISAGKLPQAFAIMSDSLAKDMQIDFENIEDAQRRLLLDQLGLKLISSMQMGRLHTLLIEGVGLPQGAVIILQYKRDTQTGEVGLTSWRRADGAKTKS